MPIPSSLIDNDVVRKRDDRLGIEVAAYSSLSDDDSDDDQDDVLEPPGLLLIMWPADVPPSWRCAVVAQVRVECGDPDNDMSTRAALHSFIGSAWLGIRESPVSDMAMASPPTETDVESACWWW